MPKTENSKIRIVSHDDRPFSDRRDAGKALARELTEYRNQKPLILGVPRGGIIVAQEVAIEFNAELDVILAHKLRTPGYGELAMGSVSERGDLILNEDVVRDARVPDYVIQQEKAVQMAEITRRARLFRAVRPRVPITNRVVIITDDGVATGATTQAAIKAAKAEKPKTLVLAVPVGSEDTLIRLAADVDDLVCLKSPPGLSAVGQIYLRFEPVTDEEVVDILKKQMARSMIR